MNHFRKIRLMNRIGQEIGTRIDGGMDTDQACDEVLGVVEREFGAGIDWQTLLPMILQLIAVLSQLFNPPAPTASPPAVKR